MSTASANDLTVEGAPISFGEIYEQARRALMPTLRRRVGPAADDLFQEAMLIAYERWDDIAGVDNKMAWLRTVAMRLAGRWHQREGRRPLLEAMAGAPGPEFIASLHRDLDLLDSLAVLRPEHSEAFRLTHIEDLDAASVARELGVAEPTVKVWVHRSRQRLAEQSMGLRGRWVCESDTSPAALERLLLERGHGAYVDDAMPCLVDRRVRWHLSIGDGKYCLTTDDGESMDQGAIKFGSRSTELRSVCLVDWVDGVSAPSAVRDVGASAHTIDIDGDRMRLRLRSTDIRPTNGVPDIVYRELFFHDIIYRWIGP